MKIRNGYFYSEDSNLLDRIAEELAYSGRKFKRIPGGIMQYAIVPRKPKRDDRKPKRDG